MRAFLLSLAALRDNHTHSDVQVVSTHHTPSPQPQCQTILKAQPLWSSPVT